MNTTRRYPTRMTSWAAALSLAALTSTSAQAADPPYVGLWSKRMEHCSTDQKRPGAPMIMTDKGFDQHDLHCTFRKLEPIAPLAEGATTVKMAADCKWGNVDRPMEMTLSVTADKLTLIDAGGTSVLMKCAR